MSCCENCGITKGQLYREDIPNGLVFCGLECQQELIGSGEILQFAQTTKNIPLTWQLFLGFTTMGHQSRKYQGTPKDIVYHIAREFFDYNQETQEENNIRKAMLSWIVDNPTNIPDIRLSYTRITNYNPVVVDTIFYDKKTSFLLPFITYAIRRDSVEMVRFIVEDLHMQFRIDEPIHRYIANFAFRNEKLNVLKWILDTYTEFYTPKNFIFFASVNGLLDVMKMLILHYNVDPSYRDNMAILEASRNGHTDIVKFLIEDARVDPSDNENAAINLASKEGHPEIVRLLIQHKKVDPSNNNNRPLKNAVERKPREFGPKRLRYIEVIKLLLHDPRVQKKISWKRYSSFREEFDFEKEKEIWQLLQLIHVRHVLERGYINDVKELLNDKYIQANLSDEMFDQIKKQFENDNEIKQLLKQVSVTQSRGKLQQEEEETTTKRRKNLGNKIKLN